MSAPAALPMSADAFIAWAIRQPKGRRYELVAGDVVAMAPERALHTETKFRVTRALDDAIRAAGLPCQAFVDGLSVQVDDATVYEPDAQVRCGERLDPDTVVITDPVIVVEVVSPGSAAVDAGAKLEDYFRLPSVQHYLIVKPKTRTIIHHARTADASLRTTIHREGSITLAPPGITVALAALLP